jgi:hypothetical protein
MKMSVNVLFSLLLTSSALAYDEPAGLQMLRFGEDARTALPKCDTLSAADKFQKPCWRQHDVWVADESKLAVQNIKVGEITLRINVEQIDDKLELIEATFPGLGRR